MSDERRENRRERIRRKMIEKQIVEVRTAIVNMEDARNGALFHDFSYVTIDTLICGIAIKNLKDLEKKYLLEQIREE